MREPPKARGKTESLHACNCELGIVTHCSKGVCKIFTLSLTLMDQKRHILYQQFGLENSCADLFEGSQLLFLRLEWVLICWKAALSKMWGTSFKLFLFTTRKIRTTSDPANNSAGKKLSPGVATGLHRGTSIPNSGPRTGPTMPV